MMIDKDYELLERFIEGAKESYEKVENHSYIFPITISRAYQISKIIEKLLKEHESRWVSIPHKKDRVCERCGYDEPYKNAEKETMIYKFCPNCGARMNGGEVNDT